MQMPRRIHLRTQHRSQPLRQSAHQSHRHPAHRPHAPQPNDLTPGQHLRQRLPVRHITRHHLNPRTQPHQLRHQAPPHPAQPSPAGTPTADPAHHAQPPDAAPPPHPNHPYHPSPTPHRNHPTPAPQSQTHPHAPTEAPPAAPPEPPTPARADANARDNTAPDTAPSPRSSNVIRPGCSDCADRTKPHTDATARSLTAPRATTTRRDPANRSSSNHP